MHWKSRFYLAPAAAVLFSAPGLGGIQIQSLTPTPPSPSPVATPVSWAVAASDTSPGQLEYRFSARMVGAANFLVWKDYHPTNTFLWVANQREGIYQVKVSVRNKSTAEIVELAKAYQVTSRAGGGTAVVSPTDHPLVALFSAPPCDLGKAMRVRFQRGPAAVSDTTPLKLCNGQHSMNFYIAGMAPTTTYYMRWELVSGSGTTPGPALPFTTGALPAGFVTPAISLPVPPNAQTSLTQKLILHDYVIDGATLLVPTVTNLTGQVVWYYDKARFDGRFFVRLVSGGTLLLTVDDTINPNPAFRTGQTLREIDLAGNALRETNVPRVSEQLAAMGKDSITSFHHEAIRLANGHTLVLCSNERMYPAGTQGSPTPVDILGDMIVDLDENFQVVWAWNGFDHLDVNRAASLGETCAPLQAGCPPFALAPTANDWLHSNSIDYGADGNLLLSMRHQDWVIKINYANGAGSGNILWKLGKAGDFTITPVNDPDLWFSHQHDSGFEDGGTQVLSLYDNSNLRRVSNPVANSRGQVWTLNEGAKTATPTINADLGVYSFAVGNAHKLGNGNYHFHSGIINGTVSQAAEVLPVGTINYNMQSNAVSYRSYRLTDMYTPPAK